jgi:hypothetical protein
MRRIVVHNHLIVSGRIAGCFLLVLTLLFIMSPAEARHHHRRSQDQRDWTERKDWVQQGFWPICDFLFHCEQGGPVWGMPARRDAPVPVGRIVAAPIWCPARAEFESAWWAGLGYGYRAPRCEQ